MTKEEAKNLIQIFIRRGGFESRTWIDHKTAKNKLIEAGSKKEVFEELLNALLGSDENIVIHVIEILGEIGNKAAIPYLEKVHTHDRGYLIGKILWEALDKLDKWIDRSNVSVDDLTSKSSDELIKVLGSRRDEYTVKIHREIKRILVKRGEIDILIRALRQDNQNILSEVAEILGELNDKSSIPILKEILKRGHDLWGITTLNVAVALLKLGDRIGLDFLVTFIRDVNVHPELRLDAARELIKLGLIKVFDKNEKMDFDSASIGKMWSERLNRLLARLRKT